MPGMFIDVEVDASVASDPDLVKKLTEVCAVDIFAGKDDGSLQIIEDNLDECVLSQLRAPGPRRDARGAIDACATEPRVHYPMPDRP